MSKLTGDMITAIIIVFILMLGVAFMVGFYNFTEMQRYVACTNDGGQYYHGGCKR